MCTYVCFCLAVDAHLYTGCRRNKYKMDSMLCKNRSCQKHFPVVFAVVCLVWFCHQIPNHLQLKIPFSSKNSCNQFFLLFFLFFFSFLFLSFFLCFFLSFPPYFIILPYGQPHAGLKGFISICEVWMLFRTELIPAEDSLLITVQHDVRNTLM